MWREWTMHAALNHTAMLSDPKHAMLTELHNYSEHLLSCAASSIVYLIWFTILFMTQSVCKSMWQLHRSSCIKIKWHHTRAWAVGDHANLGLVNPHLWLKNWSQRQHLTQTICIVMVYLTTVTSNMQGHYSDGIATPNLLPSPPLTAEFSC